MKYIGLQSQIWRNNTRSFIMLVMFPVVLFVLTWVFFFVIANFQESEQPMDFNAAFIQAIPWIAGAVCIWFLIAYSSHTSMIRKATGSKPLERRENKRVYNLVENLCIASGMKMPKVNIIEDDSLNAFASGINQKTFTVTLSRGIINRLDDDQLEGVIAHELTHIQNRDVRVLIVSIIFVGIFAFLSQTLMRSLMYSGGRSKKGKGGAAIIVALVLALIGYGVTILFRFAISRNREYMADAGAAQLTKKPEALASALQAISIDPRIEAVEREDVAQLFIENPQKKKKGMSFSSIFATHPPIAERIRVLEQF